MEISTFIKPSIGRVVWYRPSEDDRSRDLTSDGEQPLAAIIAYVHLDELVNLMVLSSDGYARARQNVMLIQGEKDVPEGCCCWMPYQIGQASKTAELEAKVAGVASEPALAEAKAPVDAPVKTEPVKK